LLSFALPSGPAPVVGFPAASIAVEASPEGVAAHPLVCGMFRPTTAVAQQNRQNVTPAPNRRDVADLLEEEEIEQRTDELGDWEREGNSAIQKVFEFEDFTAAIKFVNEVAKLADRYDHHPDIDIRWNRVKLVLSTHSEGGLTARDFDVAGEIEQSIQY
jgi:4a-hydroxytetrahydrobiopterin dehydratase